MSKSLCVHCNADISHKRKNAKFCSDRCRKDKSQIDKRQNSKVNATSSVTERRNQKELFDSHFRISEFYYNTVPAARPAILIDLIRTARFGDNKSKRILLDLSRFDSAPLIAFTATKETDYGTETNRRI